MYLFKIKHVLLNDLKWPLKVISAIGKLAG